MSDRLVLLGTKGGPALRPGGARPTSTLLSLSGTEVVVDAGLGVTGGLCDAGFDLRQLRYVAITHLHADHVLELGALLHTAWTTGLQHRVDVWGPPGLVEVWAGFLASMAYDVAIRVRDEGRTPLADLVRIMPLEAGTAVSVGGLRVDVMAVPHPPVEPNFAFKFTAPNAKVVVFSGDTAFHPPLSAFAKAADALVHEALLARGVERLVAATGLGDALRTHLHASHTSAFDAGRIAALAGVKRLVLHHLVPADDPAIARDEFAREAQGAFSGEVVVGRDALVVAL